MPIAPYTPREPDDGAAMMHGSFLLNVLGTWTIIVTFWLPLPSSAYAIYSVPAIFPSPAVTLPAESMFGPYSTP